MKKVLILLTLLFTLQARAAEFEAGLAGFSVEIRGEINPYNIFSVFVLPQEQFTLKAKTPISVEGLGDLSGFQSEWTLRAPAEKGVHKVRIKTQNNSEMVLNVLVMTPISEKKGEHLNGYRVGNYPAKALKGNPIYNRPKGLFEIQQEWADLQLSPHFTLRQFICKQAGGYPKYLIVRERLLLKLEFLLGKVNDAGYEAHTFGFISGYRTPFYNKAIKNVAYSRHVYGGAADIFIDQNGDGAMDDLNKDGSVNEADVRIFYNIVEKEFGKPGYDKFRGGLGFYRKNGAHKGFIHVDVRGWKARW